MHSSTSPSRIVRLATAELASPVRKQAWIGIGVATGLTAAKFVAWQITGSVGFYSDMLESFTVLIGAILAVAAIRVSGRAPDERHAFGHAKAEYFASFLESVLILATTALILVSAIERLRHPRDLENGWLGTAIALGSGLASLVFARQLFRSARRERSVSLQAEARHLVVSAVVSLGVVIGVVLTLVIGWDRLDPLIAIAVGLIAGATGFAILAETLQGLMDSQIEGESLASVQRVLDADATALGIVVLTVRTRAAGSEDFVEVTVAMPGEWSVARARAAMDRLQRDLIALQPGRTVSVVLGANEPGDMRAPGPVISG
ncbi:MAG: cation diffusion facilitator family transporter [Thermomicrobiales bacterium]